jgi:hypothetical protein
VSILTDEARRENALALATAAGVSLQHATERLQVAVLVSHQPNSSWAAQLATEASQLLSRTVETVLVTTDETSRGAVRAELIIGNAPRQSSAVGVYVAVTSELATVARSRFESDEGNDVPPLWLSMLACYACAGVLHAIFGDVLPYEFPEPFALRFDELRMDRSLLREPVDIGRTFMAGAGAVGNAVLWAARHTAFQGDLVIADDDRVDSSNLNRQVWFGTPDLGQPKATRLATLAQPALPGLKLIPEPRRLQDVSQKTDGPWLTRLLVTVDSRRARRAVQLEFPGEVFDASTTDIREVVSFYNRQPTDLACLSCVYEPDTEEYSRERHIAEHLGVEVGEVQSERISESAAGLIASRFNHLNAGALIGLSYDTLFKTLCAEGELQTLEGKRTVAPFAFVSCLAGVLIVTDLVRRLGRRKAKDNYPGFNYWRVSAWHPPLARRQQQRPRQSGCQFCGNSTFVKVNKALWGASPTQSERVNTVLGSVSPQT